MKKTDINSKLEYEIKFEILKDLKEKFVNNGYHADIDKVDWNTRIAIWKFADDVEEGDPLLRVFLKNDPIFVELIHTNNAGILFVGHGKTVSVIDQDYQNKVFNIVNDFNDVEISNLRVE